MRMFDKQEEDNVTRGMWKTIWKFPASLLLADNCIDRKIFLQLLSVYRYNQRFLT